MIWSVGPNQPQPPANAIANGPTEALEPLSGLATNSIFSSLIFVKNNWIGLRANRWPIIGEDIILFCSFQPLPSFRFRNSDPWRAFLSWSGVWKTHFSLLLGLIVKSRHNRIELLMVFRFPLGWAECSCALWQRRNRRRHEKLRRATQASRLTWQNRS